METPQIYISYARADADFALKLAKELKLNGFNIWIDQVNITPGSRWDEQIEQALQKSDYILFILSTNEHTPNKVPDEISYALEHDKKIVPLAIHESEVPYDLKGLEPINFTINYNEAFNSLLNALNFGPPSKAMPSGPPYFPGKSAETKSEKSSRKNMVKEDSVSSNKQPPTSEPMQGTSRGAEPHPTKAKPPAHEMPPPPAPAPQATPPPAPAPAQPSKGKILYDIPDNMLVKQQHKCIVRIGKTEAIVRDKDDFSGAEKVKDIPIARVMNVELIDIADPPHFSIKAINAAEQEVEVEEDSYTQWLFGVTPLMEGNFSLIIKVSVIKLIDGKERRKELVFEKLVNIAAQPAPSPQGIKGDQSKDLMAEKDIAELDPPNVFISYAHRDKDYFDIFMENLSAQSGWNIWTDKNIEIGSDWYDRIQQAIKDSDMAVLLVSAFFISSAFIKEQEYEKFSDLQQGKRGFMFLPVLLRDVDINRWQSLSQLQFFSADGDDYGFPDLKGKLLPFAALCVFNEKGELNENYRRDTYFKNFVTKANTDWLKTRNPQPV